MFLQDKILHDSDHIVFLILKGLFGGNAGKEIQVSSVEKEILSNPIVLIDRLRFCRILRFVIGGIVEKTARTVTVKIRKLGGILDIGEDQLVLERLFWLV